MNSNTFTNAFINPVDRGVINPNNKVTYKRELHFDSRFRNNYGAPGTSASSFLYTLPTEIQNVVSIRLSSIHVPNSVLTISEQTKNNSFYINDTLVTIPPGIYTLVNLLATINNQIIIDTGLDIEFVKDPENNDKTNIISKVEAKITFYKRDNCTNFMSTLGWLLGFRVAYVTLNNGSVVKASALFDNSFTDYIYFTADDFQRNMCNNNTVYLNKTTSNNNILGKIYRSPWTGTFFFNNTITTTSYECDRGRIYFGPVRLSKFKFSLIDKFGNLVDLNNMDYSFTLEVEVLYDRKNVTIPC